MLAHDLLEYRRPFLHCRVDDLFARSTATAGNDRFSSDDFVFLIARPHDEQRINWRFGNERENKWPVRQRYFATENFYRRTRHFADDPIALNRDDFAGAQIIQ